MKDRACRKLSDKWAHCMISCRASKVCGPLLIQLGGLTYEGIQFFQRRLGLGSSGFDPKDLLANLTGSACAGWESVAVPPIGPLVGLLWRESCDDCCTRAYPNPVHN